MPLIALFRLLRLYSRYNAFYLALLCLYLALLRICFVITPFSRYNIFALLGLFFFFFFFFFVLFFFALIRIVSRSTILQHTLFSNATLLGFRIYEPVECEEKTQKQQNLRLA